MRQVTVLIAVAVAALAAWASDAAFAEVPVFLRTAGAQGFELQNGNGRAAVTGRGALLVTVRRGRIRVVDLPGGGRPNVSDRCRQRGRRVSPTTLELRGSEIGCVVWTGANGGRWQVIAKGRGVSASGSVRGSLTLDAFDSGPTGRFRIDAGDWKRWPREADTIALRT